MKIDVAQLLGIPDGENVSYDAVQKMVEMHNADKWKTPICGVCHGECQEDDEKPKWFHVKMNRIGVQVTEPLCQSCLDTTPTHVDLTPVVAE